LAPRAGGGKEKIEGKGFLKQQRICRQSWGGGRGGEKKEHILFTFEEKEKKKKEGGERGKESRKPFRLVFRKEKGGKEKHSPPLCRGRVASPSRGKGGGNWLFCLITQRNFFIRRKKKDEKRGSAQRGEVKEGKEGTPP